MSASPCCGSTTGSLVAAQSCHVILVIDDVQWADRSTLDAIMYVIAGPACRRLAVIATLRAGEVGLGHPLQRWLADIRRLPRNTELTLDPLDRDAPRQLRWPRFSGVPRTSRSWTTCTHTHAGTHTSIGLWSPAFPPDARTAPDALPDDLSSAVLQYVAPPIVGDATTRERASGGRTAYARRRARGGGTARIRAGFGSSCRSLRIPARSWSTVTGHSGSTTR